MKELKIAVVGLGYIGLPTALMMSANGYLVQGIDMKDKLVQALNEGKLPFEEKGIATLYAKAVKNNINFTTVYEQADVYIVCVATPCDKKTKKMDSSYVIQAVKNILEICMSGSIIVVESTVSPGTMDIYIRPLFTQYGFHLGEDIHLVHAPERILPGNMMYELEHNARIIGADDDIVGNKIKEIYQTFCKGDIEVTDIKTAEMIKVIENTYRDVNIAFANELLKICENAELDVNNIIRLANKHPRVNILSPGPGVGGHCIPVDPWFLVSDYPKLAKLIKQARLVNDNMPDYVLQRIYKIAQHEHISMERVGLYGLTYKENVDDYRYSPTLQLMDRMQSRYAVCPKSFDPMLKEKIVENQYQKFSTFLNDINILVVMVNHLHLKENIQEVKSKIILNTRKSDIIFASSNIVMWL